MNKDERRFAVFDIDGTLFRSGLYREVFNKLIDMGALPELLQDRLSDKQNAWQRRAHGRAFKEFEQSMAELMDQHLPRLKIEDFDLAAEQVIADHKDNVYVYTRDLARSLKKQGYFLIAISGSQKELVEPFAKHYGFDTWVGQEFERGETYFTGNIVKTHKNKGPLLQKVIEDNNLTTAGSVAIGDSSGDIDLFTAVESPIVFNPDQDLLAIAQKHSWKIVVERKNVIYTLTYNGSQYELSTTNTWPATVSWYALE